MNPVPIACEHLVNCARQPWNPSGGAGWPTILKEMSSIGVISFGYCSIPKTFKKIAQVSIVCGVVLLFLVINLA